jgi:hypothetical protein
LGVTLETAEEATTYSVAGSVAVNEITNEILAYVTSSTVATGTGATTVTATDNTLIVGVAGSVEYGGTKGVGAAAAANVVAGHDESVCGEQRFHYGGTVGQRAQQR